MRQGHVHTKLNMCTKDEYKTHQGHDYPRRDDHFGIFHQFDTHQTKDCYTMMKKIKDMVNNWLFNKTSKMFRLLEATKLRTNFQ